jgi:hypothetical protein
VHAYGRQTLFYVARDGAVGLPEKLHRLRIQLPTCWRMVSQWESLRPWRPRVPIAEDSLNGMISVALNEGMPQAERRLKSLWIVFSVMLRLGFYDLLRPGELHGLSKYDVPSFDTHQRCYSLRGGPFTAEDSVGEWGPGHINSLWRETRPP